MYIVDPPPAANQSAPSQHALVWRIFKMNAIAQNVFWCGSWEMQCRHFLKYDILHGHGAVYVSYPNWIIKLVQFKSKCLFCFLFIQIASPHIYTHRQKVTITNNVQCCVIIWIMPMVCVRFSLSMTNKWIWQISIFNRYITKQFEVAHAAPGGVLYVARR